MKNRVPDDDHGGFLPASRSGAVKLRVPDDDYGAVGFLRVHGFECGLALDSGYVRVGKDGVFGISTTWRDAYLEWYRSPLHHGTATIVT